MQAISQSVDRVEAGCEQRIVRDVLARFCGVSSAPPLFHSHCAYLSADTTAFHNLGRQPCPNSLGRFGCASIFFSLANTGRSALKYAQAHWKLCQDRQCERVRARDADLRTKTWTMADWILYEVDTPTEQTAGVCVHFAGPGDRQYGGRATGHGVDRKS